MDFYELLEEQHEHDVIMLPSRIEAAEEEDKDEAEGNNQSD